MQLHRTMSIGISVVAVIVGMAYLRLNVPQTTARYTGIAGKQERSLVVSAKSATASVDDVSVLREEVDSLRAELAQLRKSLIAGSNASAGNGRQPQSGSQNATENNDESGTGSRNNAPTREAAAREHQEQIASMEASFRKESIDPTWSANTSGRIQSVLGSDELSHMQADSIECRSERCRVELHDDGSGQLNKHLPMMAVRLAGTLPNMTVDSATRSDGSLSMVLYLSRQSPEASSPTR